MRLEQVTFEPIDGRFEGYETLRSTAAWRLEQGRLASWQREAEEDSRRRREADTAAGVLVGLFGGALLLSELADQGRSSRRTAEPGPPVSGARPRAPTASEPCGYCNFGRLPDGSRCGQCQGSGRRPVLD